MSAHGVALALERLPVTSLRRGHETVARILKNAACTLRDQQDELKQLRVKVRRLQRERAVESGAIRPRSAGKLFFGSAEEVAAEFAEWVTGSRDLYALRSGQVQATKPGAAKPINSELVGTYDEGCDCRLLAEDIQCAREVLLCERA